MFEITRKNCFKCDLETIIDNNGQYVWINLKDFEVETEYKSLNIFNKHGNSSTLKYRRELTPNIKFQADRIFIRNDLFEPIIKTCKATNIEFLMLKEKLGICPYEENYNKKTIDELLDEFLDETKEEFFEEFDKEFGKESNKESNKESSDEELMEIIDPKKDKDTTDWYDKNKFKKNTNWYWQQWF